MEKHDLSLASEVSTQNVASSLNAAELSELQELLTQKRSELELHNEKSTSVTETGDMKVQQTEEVLAGMYCVCCIY